jgi:hypothetical protein
LFATDPAASGLALELNKQPARNGSNAAARIIALKGLHFNMLDLIIFISRDF